MAMTAMTTMMNNTITMKIITTLPMKPTDIPISNQETAIPISNQKTVLNVALLKIYLRYYTRVTRVILRVFLSNRSKDDKS